MNEPKQDPFQNRVHRSEVRRKFLSSWFSTVCMLVSSLAIVVLVTLLISIFSSGGSWLNWNFLTASHFENNPEKSGIGQALIGSLAICLICGLFALPIGVATAVFLEEFQPRNRWLRMLHGLVQLNINNLAGVPSIVYGILGLTAFVYMFGTFSSIRVNEQPDYEVGATYYYQTKTLGGDFVKFPAVAAIQPTFELQSSKTVIKADGKKFKLNIVSRSVPEERYADDKATTAFRGTKAKLETRDGKEVYVSKTLDETEFTFAATKRYSSFAKILEPIEVTNSNGESFMLNVLSKKDDIPSDEAVKMRSVFKDSPNPRKRSSASIFRETSFFHMHFPFSKSVLSAGLTLALVILPIVIIASQEAIRGVPDSLRVAAFGMGATRWQMVRGAVLPVAIPGIMTGAILAMSRAIGEAAPLLAVMGGVLGTTSGLTNLMDKTPALPVTIFKWSGDENAGFENLSAAAIIVLLIVLLLMNSVAIVIRYRFEKKLAG